MKTFYLIFGEARSNGFDQFNKNKTKVSINCYWIWSKHSKQVIVNSVTSEAQGLQRFCFKKNRNSSMIHKQQQVVANFGITLWLYSSFYMIRLSNIRLNSVYSHYMIYIGSIWVQNKNGKHTVRNILYPEIRSLHYFPCWALTYRVDISELFTCKEKCTHRPWDFRRIRWQVREENYKEKNN